MKALVCNPSYNLGGGVNRKKSACPSGDYDFPETANTLKVSFCQEQGTFW